MVGEEVTELERIRGAIGTCLESLGDIDAEATMFALAHTLGLVAAQAGFAELPLQLVVEANNVTAAHAAVLHRARPRLIGLQ